MEVCQEKNIDEDEEKHERKLYMERLFNIFSELLKQELQKKNPEI